MKFHTIKTVLFNFIFLCSLYCFGQFSIPKKPDIIQPIYDYANVLAPQQYEALRSKLIDYQKETSSEILILTVKTLNQDDANMVATEWGHKWLIGQKKEDNGIVILIAIEDRKMAIQTGRGVEPLLTDGLSKRLITNVFVPNLKNGDYYTALDAGIDNIKKILQGEFKNTQTNEQPQTDLFPFILIALFILFILFMGARRRGNGLVNSSSMTDDVARSIILSNMGRRRYDDSGGGFFGDSSGGGSSFGGFGGGGDFGGGGASGSW